MYLMSPHERASVQKRITTVEGELRALHDHPRLSPRQKFEQWLLLYGELKRLRRDTGSARITTWRLTPRVAPAVPLA